MINHYKFYLDMKNYEIKFDIFYDFLLANDIVMIFGYNIEDFEYFNEYEKVTFIEEFDEDIKRLLY